MILRALSVNLVCLILQAFFAGAEMAIISCNRIKVRHRAEMGERRARIVQRFLEEPRNLLATTLVGYNLAVVTGSCVLNRVISNFVPPGTENIFSLAINWPLVLIIGQIVPMSYGRQHADRISLIVARPLLVASYLLFPLASIASLLGRSISMIFTRGRAKRNPFVTREELELMLKESHDSGVLEKDEKEMIEQIFHFGTTTARQVMVPLIDLHAAPETATADQVRALIATVSHSRIPLYRDRIDRITGTVHATDLIGIPGDTPVKNISSPSYCIPGSASIEAVFAELQRNKRHMAIVVDEYGGADGILTLEDIVEQIVGEIGDEHDVGGGAQWSRRKEGLIVGARMRIHEFNEEFGQHLPEEGIETVGGFVTDLLGRIPRQGDEVTYEHLKFRVTEATDRRPVTLEVRGERRDTV